MITSLSILVLYDQLIFGHMTKHLVSSEFVESVSEVLETCSGDYLHCEKFMTSAHGPSG